MITLRKTTDDGDDATASSEGDGVGHFEEYDVTASPESSGIGHFEKLTSQQAAGLVALAILKEWSGRRPHSSEDDRTTEDGHSGSEA